MSKTYEIDEIVDDLRELQLNNSSSAISTSEQVTLDSCLHQLLDLALEEFGPGDGALVQLEVILENGEVYNSGGSRDVAERMLAWAEQIQKKIERKETKLLNAIKSFHPVSHHSHSRTYVCESRLEALRSLTQSDFDYSKLVQLCGELNLANQNRSILSVGILVRAIIDHVPPIFGCSKFSEVANNYGGSQSFRQSMESLAVSLRKISDGYLHTQIRAHEVLPTEIQVDFKPQLDELLGEIIRISS